MTLLPILFKSNNR